MNNPSKLCLQCGTEFYKKPYTSKKEWEAVCKYCCKDCYTESMKGVPGNGVGNAGNPAWNKGVKTPQTTGENNSRWSRVQLDCLECGESFEAKNYRKDIAKFCSAECSQRDRDEGKTTEAMRIRKSMPYKQWRTSVFERDDYTCQECGERGGTLNADHIKPFALHPDLRLDTNNGRTLCECCHRNTDTYGTRLMWKMRRDLVANET